MKRKASVISMLLALLMILGACGGANDKPDVGAAETLQPTAEPTQQPTGPGVAATRYSGRNQRQANIHSRLRSRHS